MAGIVSDLLTAIQINKLIICQLFFSPVSILHAYKSTTHSSFQYCCHIYFGAPTISLQILDKMQRSICHLIGPDLISRVFYKYFPGSDELSVLIPRGYKFKSDTRLAGTSHHIIVEIARCNRKSHENNFFYRSSH